MGGQRECIIVEKVGDAPALAETFRRCNVAKAQCLIQRDREVLLAMIESGFGDLRDFTRVLRTVLVNDQATSPAVVSMPI